MVKHSIKNKWDLQTLVAMPKDNAFKIGDYHNNLLAF